MATKFTHVYHVSPVNHIHTLRATGSTKGIQAVPQHQAGVYVAPKYSDAIEWFISYVAHNKNLKHEQHRSTRLRNECRGWQKAPNYYQHATIYKIKIPVWVLKQSWHSNNWEHEYFITHLDQLEIIWSRTYTYHELTQASRRRDTYRNQINTLSYDAVAKRAPHNPAAQAYLQLKNYYANKVLRTPRPKKPLYIPPLRYKPPDYVFKGHHKSPEEELLHALLPYFCQDQYWRPHPIPTLTLAKKQELQPLIHKIQELITPK